MKSLIAICILLGGVAVADKDNNWWCHLQSEGGYCAFEQSNCNDHRARSGANGDCSAIPKAYVVKALDAAKNKWMLWASPAEWMCTNDREVLLQLPDDFSNVTECKLISTNENI